MYNPLEKDNWSVAALRGCAGICDCVGGGRGRVCLIGIKVGKAISVGVKMVIKNVLELTQVYHPFFLLCSRSSYELHQQNPTPRSASSAAIHPQHKKREEE